MFKKCLLIVGIPFFMGGCSKDLTHSGHVPAAQAQAIIGGQEAPAKAYPFIVNIWLNNPQDHYVDHLCGGSLIDPKWVLTAAHCVIEDASESTYKTTKPQNLQLYIGSDKISGEGGLKLTVRSIVIHPQFSWPYHDVALIELTQPVVSTSPIQLSTQDPELNLTQAIVIGWGLTDREGKQDGAVLQMTTIDLLPRKECAQDPFPQKRGWTIGLDMICAQTMNNQKASCPGDSGGPLFIKTNNQFTQIGIVSWGSACAGKYSNGSSVEGYSAVSDALPWIQSVIKK